MEPLARKNGAYVIDNGEGFGVKVQNPGDGGRSWSEMGWQDLVDHILVSSFRVLSSNVYYAYPP